MSNIMTIFFIIIYAIGVFLKVSWPYFAIMIFVYFYFNSMKHSVKDGIEEAIKNNFGVLEFEVLKEFIKESIKEALEEYEENKINTGE